MNFLMSYKNNDHLGFYKFSKVYWEYNISNIIFYKKNYTFLISYKNNIFELRKYLIKNLKNFLSPNNFIYNGHFILIISENTN